MIRVLLALVISLIVPGSGHSQQKGGQMAINLAAVADWTTEQPFLDVMKTARPWIGHLPGQWGGATHEDLDAAGYLDRNGWPVEKPPELGSIGTLILTDQPVGAVALSGRYRLRFDGDGIVEVGGRATNVRYGQNEVQFDFVPGQGFVEIRIQRTDRARKGDYVRNITVVKLDHTALFDSGQIFNPDWFRLVEGFSVFRFMDWMQTNGSEQSAWEGRPQVGDYTYSLRGVPVEVMVALANQAGVDPWFNMPHLADDAYVRRFAELVRERLAPDRKAYVELSNEVWNWMFPQATWADRGAHARWDTKDVWLQYYAMRASQVAQIWTEVFETAAETRLVRVIATQTVWLGLEADILAAPLWMAEPGAASHGTPASYFDAYAVTGYFGYALGQESRAPMVREWIAQSRALAEAEADRRGLTGEARDNFVHDHRFDAAYAQAAAEVRDGTASGEAGDTLVDFLERVLPYQAEVATRNGLDLVMYEGGTHIVGLGPVMDDEELTEFFINFNYSAEMGQLYADLIDGWARAGGKLFNAFNDVSGPSKWGSWGALRHLSDDNPRWQALVSAR